MKTFSFCRVSPITVRKPASKPQLVAAGKDSEKENHESRRQTKGLLRAFSTLDDHSPLPSLVLGEISRSSRVNAPETDRVVELARGQIKSKTDLKSAGFRRTISITNLSGALVNKLSQ